MKNVRERPKTKRLLKLNKKKSSQSWTWILQLNMSKENGTGFKPRVSSSLRREKEARVKERRRKSETFIQV